MQRRFIYPTIIIILLTGTIFGLVYANYQYSIKNPGGNDFLSKWNAAYFWVVKGISPYDSGVSLAAQQMVYGRPADVTKGEDPAQFLYPFFSMIFFAPFGILDYPIARALWMTLLEASVISIVFLSIQLTGISLKPIGVSLILLSTILGYISVRTIILGQLGGINALIIIAAIFMVQKKRDTEAGILLALSLIKPQMSYLIVPFVFFWGLSVHRPKLSWTIVFTFMVLMIISIFLLPQWPMQWLQQVFTYTDYTNIGAPVSIIANVMPGISKPLTIFLTAILSIYLLLEWVLAMGKSKDWFVWTALMTLVISNLIAFRTATPHYLVFFPVLLLVIKIWRERWKVNGAIWGWFVVIALWLGMWGLFLATVKGNEEQAVMYLPLPILCLLGLWWVRWWAIKPPTVWLDEFNVHD